jgi:hypothetical protein
MCQATVPVGESTNAPVVRGDRAVAERLRRDQLESPRTWEPTCVQGRAVAGDSGVDERERCQSRYTAIVADSQKCMNVKACTC